MVRNAERHEGTINRSIPPEQDDPSEGSYEIASPQWQDDCHHHQSRPPTTRMCHDISEWIPERQRHQRDDPGDSKGVQNDPDVSGNGHQLLEIGRGEVGV